jgi:hypothetical protein
VDNNGHVTIALGRCVTTRSPFHPWGFFGFSDHGQGVPSGEVEQPFFGERARVHALVVLRRRLQGLFGRAFQLEVRSEIGEGTTATMRIPLRKQFEVGLEAKRATSSEVRS